MSEMNNDVFKRIPTDLECRGWHPDCGRHGRRGRAARKLSAYTAIIVAKPAGSRALCVDRAGSAGRLADGACAVALSPAPFAGEDLGKLCTGPDRGKSEHVSA